MLQGINRTMASIYRMLTSFMCLVHLLGIRCYADDRLALLGKLTQDNKIAFLPPYQSGVYVNVTAELLRIQELSVNRNSMTSTLLLKLGWTDDRLRWQISDYNVSVISLPLSAIWRPDIVIYNSFADGNELSHGAISVEQHGAVTWDVRVHLETSCDLKTRKFPFDKHRCEVALGPDSRDQSTVVLLSRTRTPDITSVRVDPQWVLTSAGVELRSDAQVVGVGVTSQLTYVVTLSRGSHHAALLETVLPLTLIVLVSLVGFYLPPESGSKVTLNGVMLVCMTGMHRAVYPVNPSSGGDVPLLCQYLALCFTVVAVDTILTVVIIKICLNANYGRRPPKWVRAVFLSFLSEVVCLHDFRPWPSNQEKKNSEISTDSALLNINPRPKNNTTMHRELRERFALNWNNARAQGDPNPESYTWADTQFLLADILTCLQESRDADQRERLVLAHRTGIRNEWKKVAMVIDRLCAYVIFFTTLALALYIFFNVYAD